MGYPQKNYSKNDPTGDREFLQNSIPVKTGKKKYGKSKNKIRFI